MSAQTTHGKWSLVPFGCQGPRIGIQDANGKWVGEEGYSEIELIPRFSAEHARRIVACVNACDGLDTDKLERMPAPFAQMLNFGFLELWEQYATIKAQRDELLEVCKMLKRAESLGEADRAYLMKQIYFANIAAIAKAEGRA